MWKKSKCQRLKLRLGHRGTVTERFTQHLLLEASSRGYFLICFVFSSISQSQKGKKKTPTFIFVRFIKDIKDGFSVCALMHAVFFLILEEKKKVPDRRSKGCGFVDTDTVNLSVNRHNRMDFLISGLSNEEPK